MARPRFVIVDPSGNAARTNDRLAHAATLAGYEPVLLTNSADRIGYRHVRADKIFPHAIDEHGKIANPGEGEPPRILSAPYQALAQLQIRISQTLSERRTDRNAASIALLKVVPALIDIGRHATLGAAMFAWRQLFRRRPPFNRDLFAERLAGELRRLELGPKDKLLVPLVSYGLLESFLEASARLFPDHYFDCDAYFIFHASLEAPDAATYLNRYYSFSHPQSVARRMRTGMPFARCHILATNENLRDELVAVFGEGVRVWAHLSAPGMFEGPQEKARALKTPHSEEFHIGLRGCDIAERNVRELMALAERMKAKDGVTWVLEARDRHSLSEHAVRFLSACESVRIVETAGDDERVKFLLGLDALLLPCEPAVYRKRVSPIFFAAMCVGVPCIAPAGTTMAVAESRYTTKVYASPDEAAAAIEELRRDRAAAPAAYAAAIRDQARITAAHMFRNPMESDFADAHEPTIRVRKAEKVAVHVVPAWLRCGSTLAFSRQLDELIDADYFVLQALVSDHPQHSPLCAEWVFRLLRENSALSRGHVQRIASPTRLGASLLRLSGRFRNASLLDQLVQRTALATVKDPVFMRLARAADVVIVNHVHNWGWAKKLPGRRLLDTHDIQAHHMAQRGARNEQTGATETFERLFATESRIWAEADHVFVVSNEERRVVEQYNERCTLLAPYPNARQLRRVEEAEFGDFVRRNNLDESFLGEDFFECLILGDSHPCNIESVLWFMREVYLPHLRKQARLVVAGRAGEAVYRQYEWTRAPHVFFTGFIDDVDLLRARCRVSVLPDQKGEGISIKFLDAIACSHPFVATKTALRGLWFDTSRYAPPHTPEEFAQDITNLLTDPQALCSRRELSESLGKLAADPSGFRSGFRAALPH